MDEENLQQLRENREKEMQAQAQIDAVLRKTLTDEARARLNNVKLVKKELYASALQYILMLMQQGQVTEKISDEQLKAMLEKLSGAKREIKIRRK